MLGHQETGNETYVLELVRALAQRDSTDTFFVYVEHPEALPVTFERLGVEHLLLTLGERGMALIAADGVVRRIPTTARDVYDVVGAGDTVTAYLATSLAAGASAYEAAVVANYAAGVEVGKLGAATVSPDEIREAFEVHVGGRDIGTGN